MIKVLGDIRVTEYHKGEYVKDRLDVDCILDIDHWKEWQRVDESLGATVSIETDIDGEGNDILKKYETELGDDKVVYEVESVND